MSKRVIVLALNVNELSESIGLSMSFDSQVFLLESAIRFNYQKIMEYSKDASLIIVMPEYVNISINGGFIWTVEQKNQFKTRMQSLVDMFSNLVIVAGTVYVEQTVDPADREKMAKIRWQYSQNPLRSVLEAGGSRDIPDSLYFTRPVTAIRNTCYVFQYDIGVWKHDKVCPAQETSFATGRGYRDTFFRLPSLDLPIAKLRLGDKIVPIAIEICAEHRLSYVQQQMIDYEHKTGRVCEKPWLHVLVSDGMYAFPKFFVGAGVHVDKHNGVSFFPANEPADPDLDLVVFRGGLAGYSIIGVEPSYYDPDSYVRPSTSDQEFEEIYSAAVVPFMRSMSSYCDQFGA